MPEQYEIVDAIRVMLECLDDYHLDGIPDIVYHIQERKNNKDSNSR